MNTNQEANIIALQANDIMMRNPEKIENLRQATALFTRAHAIASNTELKNEIKHSLDSCSNELARKLSEQAYKLVTQTEEPELDKLKQAVFRSREALEFAIDSEPKKIISEQLARYLGNLVDESCITKNFAKANEMISEALELAKENNTLINSLKNKKIALLLSEIDYISDDHIPTFIKNALMIIDVDCEVEPQVQNVLKQIIDPWSRHLVPKKDFRDQVIDILAQVSQKLTIIEHKERIHNLEAYALSYKANSLGDTLLKHLDLTEKLTADQKQNTIKNVEEVKKLFEKALSLVTDPKLKEDIQVGQSDLIGCFENALTQITQNSVAEEKDGIGTEQTDTSVDATIEALAKASLSDSSDGLS